MIIICRISTNSTVSYLRAGIIIAENPAAATIGIVSAYGAVGDSRAGIPSAVNPAAVICRCIIVDSTTCYERARFKTVNTTAESVPLEQEPAADYLDALGEMVRQEAREVALRELGELDEQYRQVVLLKIIQGMTLRQVAEVVGISTSMANYRLNKGLAELARRLQRAGVV